MPQWARGSDDERAFVLQWVMTSIADVIQAQVDAYNARDAEAFANCYSESATVIGPDGSVMMTGRDAIASVYGQLFAQSPDLHVEIGTRISAGDWVVDEEDASGINFEGMPPAMHALIVYHVSEGRIDRAQMLA
ncbi:SgcJ/EcaC family oxidoreductase [Lapillicoccus sp.]|uniref:nuclear transport factor 2 family protein n=1 Tax=Lapillicoccus sp. TaxID=1909287 RepID=UPI003264FC4E